MTRRIVASVLATLILASTCARGEEFEVWWNQHVGISVIPGEYAALSCLLYPLNTHTYSQVIGKFSAAENWCYGGRWSGRITPLRPSRELFTSLPPVRISSGATFTLTPTPVQQSWRWQAMSS